jgi:hypothetical protein
MYSFIAGRRPAMNEYIVTIIFILFECEALKKYKDYSLLQSSFLSSLQLERNEDCVVT